MLTPNDFIKFILDAEAAKRSQSSTQVPNRTGRTNNSDMRAVLDLRRNATFVARDSGNNRRSNDGSYSRRDDSDQYRQPRNRNPPRRQRQEYYSDEDDYEEDYDRYYSRRRPEARMYSRREYQNLQEYRQPPTPPAESMSKEEEMLCTVFNLTARLAGKLLDEI